MICSSIHLEWSKSLYYYLRRERNHHTANRKHRFFLQSSFEMESFALGSLKHFFGKIEQNKVLTASSFDLCEEENKPHIASRF